MDRKVDSNYYLAPQKFAAMEEERKHIENIFYARFNYFILFFTLFLSIEVTIYSEKNILERDKWIILTALSFLGFVISLLISITLYRIRRALEVTLKYRDYNSITARLIRRKLGKRKKGWIKYGSSANYILSSTIPVLCTAFSAFLFWYAIMQLDKK